jgi:Asp-tRNA(Asn)/Glu-tRNA(Gln) amidotransferase A subunit family amidase
MSSLKETLAGFADWLGHGHVHRADAWVARLEINQPEIEAFQALASPNVSPYLAMPAALLPADGDPAASPAANPAANPAADPPPDAGSAPPLDAGAALERARAHPDWHIFITLADAAAIADGTAAPKQGSGQTQRKGFLAGMPVAIKDLMAVQGFPLTCGSGAGGTDPGHDATVVARIRGAGGVVVGTTNLHELAYGITSNNPHHGRVVNPAAPDRIPGGSSGGSAAAIAAGMAVAAVGTDTAGSIRVPAACCGVVGLKPSYGLLPVTGIADLAPSLDHVGPMAATVEDCASLFAAMADLSAVPAWRYSSLKGKRIAELGGYFDQPLDPEVRAAVKAAMAAAAQDGAACSTLELTGADMAPALQFQTICPEATAVDGERLRDHPETLGEDVRVRLEIGNFLPGHLYVKAQRLRHVLARNFDDAFANADFFVCATMRAPAPAVGATTVSIEGHAYPLHTAVTQLTLPFNLTGLPALSLPWTTSADGVPIGIQIVGPRGADWQVLAVAERLQRLAPWGARSFVHASTQPGASRIAKDGHASS